MDDIGENIAPNLVDSKPKPDTDITLNPVEYTTLEWFSDENKRILAGGALHPCPPVSLFHNGPLVRITQLGRCCVEVGRQLDVDHNEVDRACRRLLEIDFICETPEHLRQSSTIPPLPDLLELDIRISDNVCRRSDWGVTRITIEDSRITKIVTLEDGMYDWSTGPDIGWTIEQLRQWCRQDFTGQHPETYHDIGHFTGVDDCKRFIYLTAEEEKSLFGGVSYDQCGCGDTRDCRCNQV